jgi:hypothetical protein
MNLSNKYLLMGLMIILNVMSQFLNEKQSLLFHLELTRFNILNQIKTCAARNPVIRIVTEQGSQIWKQKSDYHHRSLAETAMFRINTLFGNRLKARKFESQAVEAEGSCVVLNRMTSLGLPDSCPI